MATITPEQRVQFTVPAACLDDFRYAVIRDTRSDADYFAEQHADLLEAIERRSDRVDGRREDRAGVLEGLRESARLLAQLPDDETEATVSATAAQLAHVLEQMGRYLIKRLGEVYTYGPPLFDEVPALLERLRWSAERAIEFGSVA